MNKKDITFLKKIIPNTEEPSVQKIASCFVGSLLEKKVAYQETRSFDMIDESEAAQYGILMKKGITGIPGTTQVDIRFDKNILKTLLDTGLEDEDAIENVCESIIENYKIDDNYFIYFATGSFEVQDHNVPYNFILTMLLPCKLSKPGIMYDYQNNFLKDRVKDRCLDAPLISFLYPSFEDGLIDVSMTSMFGKNAKAFANTNDLCEALFGVPVPLSAEQQKGGFEDILTSGYTGKIPYESLQNIYEKISQVKLDAVVSGGDATFSAEELADIVIEEGGINDDEKVEAVKKAVESYDGCRFSAENVAPKNVKIESGQTTIRVNLNEIGEIRKQMIDGREYYLIPATNVEIEDIAVI